MFTSAPNPRYSHVWLNSPFAKQPLLFRFMAPRPSSDSFRT